MDKEGWIDTVYLDFPKAFDKVPHPRFFEELNCHEIGRKVLTWINTWLKDRKQGMNIKLKCSELERSPVEPHSDSCWEHSKSVTQKNEIVSTNLAEAAKC